MAKGDVLVRMKADVSNYDANIAKARRTLEGFKQDNLTFGGVLNQSTKSIVAAAAQYASFAAVLGTVASGFSEAASKGMQMSREAEGVSKAFARLNQPGLLDNLRQATHNTVNDLELMKQAVKFDNFNLSLEQMGTFLAFAQQQAKDTGQDVNYLVDSIVTGLGRKSLPILDNLGLSAEEIRNRMKETGDMTTAVAQIIQERMEAAGGYVETASDRAAQAQVRLDNAMKELGDTMNSLTGTGATLWTDLKTGAIDLANTAIKPLISLFNELASYINGTSAEDILTRGMTDVTDTVDDNGRLIRKDAINSIPGITVTGNAPKRTKGGTTSTTTAPTYAADSIAAQRQLVSDLTKQWSEAGADVRNNYLKPLVEAEAKLKSMTDQAALLKEQAQGKLKGGNVQTEGLAGPNFNGFANYEGVGKGLSDDTMAKVFEGMKPQIEQEAKLTDEISDLGGKIGGLAGGLSSISSGFKAFGIELPKEVDQVIGVISGVSQVIGGVGTIIELFGTTEQAANTAALIANTTTMVGLIDALAINSAMSIIPFAHGGVVHAAQGYVPGNNYSGDMVPALLNSGELILNKAQQNALANELQGNGIQNLHLRTEVSGRNLVVVIENDLKARGKGQLATFK